MAYKYKIVSDTYISNCIIEALKAKLRDPKNVKIYICKPRITANGHLQKCHAMWTDGTADYDFSDYPNGGAILAGHLIYYGCKRQFKCGTAIRYTQRRNKQGIKQEAAENGK